MVFIGNQKSISFLNKSLEKGNINHAYLFSGPEHVGKFLLATMFGRSIIVGLKQLEFDGTLDPTASLDLLVLKPEIEEKKGITKKKAIPTEKIRDVQQELSLFPYHGAKKILIIDDAHAMTTGAQNALLKTLEEPAGTSMIILVTHEQGRLLPTIISRCQKLNFSLVSDQEMAGADENLILYAMGRPGLLKNMLEGGEQQQTQKETENELKIAIGGTINEKLKLAEELAKNTPAAMEKLSIWMWMLKSRAADLPQDKTVSAYGVIEKIDESASVLKTTNANARLVLENLFIGM